MIFHNIKNYNIKNSCLPLIYKRRSGGNVYPIFLDVAAVAAARTHLLRQLLCPKKKKQNSHYTHRHTQELPENIQLISNPTECLLD